MKPPTLSVLISCYNYGRYVQEAVRSALEQTRPVEEVVVVDDGSTDDSWARLEALREADPRVVIERTENRGQLAAMVRGVELTSADIVFFMDADDLLKPHHTETLAAALERHPYVDYVYSDYEQFGDRQGIHRSFPAGRDHDHGRTALLAKYGLRTYGGVTSTIAVRRRTLLPLLDMPDHWITEWPAAGDLALNHFVSLVGGRKMYLHQDTVRYRVHGENDHLQVAKLPDNAWMERRFRANRWIQRVAGETCPGDALLPLIDRETQSTPRLSKIEHRNLVKLIMRSPLPASARWGSILAITKQRLKASLGS
ncbi:MAG: glycosyltransferase family 2 protein [Planctomycetota bacterium]